MKEYLGLFASFFKIGLFTIGGGMAMLPLIQIRWWTGKSG